MPTKTDEHFVEQALRLARTAALAAEEAYGYAEDICDATLQEKTIREVERIIEEDR